MAKIKLRNATDEQIAQNIFDHAEDWGLTGIVGDYEGFEVDVFERGEDYIYVYISGVWHRLKSKFAAEVVIPGQIESGSKMWIWTLKLKLKKRKKKGKYL